MGGCYSGEQHRHIYADITTCKLRNHKRTTSLERSEKDRLEGEGMAGRGGEAYNFKPILLESDLALCSCSGSKHWSA